MQKKGVPEDIGLAGIQTKMIESIIDLKTKPVEKIMIRSNKMVSLDIQHSLDNKTAKRIMRLGYSRIPVY